MRSVTRWLVRLRLTDSRRSGRRARGLRLPTLIVALPALMAISLSASGQVTGAISGRIEDPSGAGVRGAAVTVNLETGATRAVVTDDAGNFRAMSLPIGPYQVRAEKTGFKTQVRNGVNLVVGQEAVVNLRLEIGDLSQDVTVTEAESGGQYHHLLGFGTGGRARSEGFAAQWPQLR